MNFLFKDFNNVSIAIERLRAFEPEDGYYLAFSGGKDSTVLYRLAQMAGVKFDAHYSFTTVDPPELVKFITQNYPDVKFEYPEISMRLLIPKKLLPPTRRARYCCRYLKECHGVGRTVLVGVRSAESAKRSGYNIIENYTEEEKAFFREKNPGVKFEKSQFELTEEPPKVKRKLVSHCYKKRKRIVSPILDWSEWEVWNFINSNRQSYCSLYDEGFKRLGCIGCPNAYKQESELKRYPLIRQMYMNAFTALLKERKRRDKQTTWKNAEEVMSWWLGWQLDLTGELFKEIEEEEKPTFECSP